MKIINLKSENFKKIKAIDITPKDNTVIVSGKNGNGKSSVLDSILVALAGKQKDIIKPIRDGEKKATIEIDLGDYKVKRIFTEKGSTVEISNGTAKYSSPQAMLDSIVGKLSFDPLEFSKKTQKEQREILMELVGVDLSLMDSKRAILYEERHQVGIEEKALAKYTDNEISEASLFSDKKEKSISELSQKFQVEKDKHAKFEHATEKIKTNNEEINRLKMVIKDIENKNKENLLIEDTDENLENLLFEINTADENNKKIRNAKNIIDNQILVEEKRINYNSYTEEIEKIDNEKKEKLEKAKMPITGLSITDDGVLYNDIPFSQISSAEQLKVSLSIAMAMNQELKVIRIMDGSLLDEDNLKAIQEMTDDKDYQVWIEKVDSSGKVGFYIEDGEIKN